MKKLSLILLSALMLISINVFAAQSIKTVPFKFTNSVVIMKDGLPIPYILQVTMQSDDPSYYFSNTTNNKLANAANSTDTFVLGSSVSTIENFNYLTADGGLPTWGSSVRVHLKAIPNAYGNLPAIDDAECSLSPYTFAQGTSISVWLDVTGKMFCAVGH